MLSRPAPPPVLPACARPDWDIFCKVVDNFGDIAVCWRLSRQLVGEYGFRVRLWIDHPAVFKVLCPSLMPERPSQDLAGIEVRHWVQPFPDVTPAKVVLETFACRIPESFVERMAQLSPVPAWINLDYLSAEDWVARYHALPSPHPRLPLNKYFFFPGFTAHTGGLLRERDLSARRQAFLASSTQQAGFWRDLGGAPPAPEALRVSLFAYENPATMDLLHAWESGSRQVCCLVPTLRTWAALDAYAGQPLAVGDIVRRGALEIRILPFLEHWRYDQLLWLCDLNFVRGEDSFVRAQWAARALVWQIYRQEDDAHLVKLDAFLTLYCARLATRTRRVVCAFWHAWNAGRIDSGHWLPFADCLPDLGRHALSWEQALLTHDDLASQLLAKVGDA